MGGLTMNLSGEEVWTLKAMGVVVTRDLKRTLARHLEFNTKSIRTSSSDNSTSFSIVGDREKVPPLKIMTYGRALALRNSRDYWSQRE